MEGQKEVQIYSTPTCHFCQAAKEFFKANDIDFTDYNVAEDSEKRNEMVEKSGQMGVPVILIGGEMTIGFDEGKVKELLGL
jgi:glutaredoxin 3